MKTKHLLFTLALCISVSIFGQIKVACVGNSITYGYGIKNPEKNSYPAQLAQLLGSEWEVANFGHSGATLLKNGNKPYWNLPEYRAALEFNPDVVIIKLGTNDSKPENWSDHGKEYIPDYKALIESFRALPSHPYVIIGLPVQVVKNTWTIKKEVVENEITPLLKELIKDEKTGVINFRKPLKKHDNLLPDNIHPNKEGAGLMLTMWLKG